MKMEDIVKYCKNYGFIFQGSEIYGGLSNTWDYGPLGVLLKNNIKDAWMKKFIQEKKNAYLVDADILMHPKVWEASGHIASFSDPLIDCKDCKIRHRADELINEFDLDVNADKMTDKEMVEFIKKEKIPCPKCGKSNYTDIREFNLMFETNRGVIKEAQNKIYLRPETAQGEYVNFLNVSRSMRAKIPFSIGNIGKAFRNEITPGNFTFRTIEFEQMEYQTFCKKGQDEELYKYYKEFGKEFFLSLGIKEENLRYHDHDKLAHYAKAACDIDYKFPFGWGEINGTHNRTDFDLTNHQNVSKTSQEYLDPETNEKYIPYVIESTYGLDRTFLAVLCECLEVEELDDDTREVLRIKPSLAPYKVCVLPLIKKIHSEKANEIFDELNKYFSCNYDETGSIGKRYRRADAIGTPFCITIDDETLNKDLVTIRNRDTMKQDTIAVDEIQKYVEENIK